MLSGRLGLNEIRIRHADRHGLLWLDRGRIGVADGCLHFVTAGGNLDAGEYRIPHQAISLILMGPGSSITHDALRLLAAHGTGLAAVGTDGVRFYTAPPIGSADSTLARRQATLWSDPRRRQAVARRMYALRMGEVVAARDVETLRGLEGVRVREAYARLAAEFGIAWKGRRYDRANPGAADTPNQAINHAASAVEAAACIAVAATSAIPQLGFVHEDASIAFILDIADLSREDVTLPVAFRAVRDSNAGASLERLVRRYAGDAIIKTNVVGAMIDRIKSLLEAS